MMLPSIFGESLFDDWFDFPFGRDFFRERPAADKSPLYANAKNLMKTDVKENDNGYEVAIDLPGFKRDEITANLENGYLMVTAAKSENKDEKDEEGRYIRRERYAGSCSRSFYVGDAVTEDEIHAKYEDGILKLTFPKKETKQVEQKKFIAIEG